MDIRQFVRVPGSHVSREFSGAAIADLHAVHVLTLDRAAVAHIAVFRDPAVQALFMTD